MTRGEVEWSWDGPPLLQMTVTEVPWAGRTRRLHALLVQGGRPGVVIVARRKRQILLVEHDRPLVGEQFLEFPRGFGEDVDGTLDDPDSPCRAGLRELREETGYAGTDARVIGRYVLDTGLVPGEVAVVEVQVPDSQPGDVDGEVLRSRWIDEDALRRLLGAHGIRDAHTLAALAFLDRIPG